MNVENHKAIKYLGIITILTFSGCVSSTPKCVGNIGTSGYFCYQGYNFGKEKTPNYKKGVRDGCRTANGTFTKNYNLSSTYPDYIKGWNKGRATCKLIVPESADPYTMRTEYQQSIDKKKQNGN